MKSPIRYLIKAQLFFLAFYILQVKEVSGQGMHFPTREVNNIVQASALSATAPNILYIQNDARNAQLNSYATFHDNVKYKSNFTIVRMAVNHAALNIPSQYVYKMVYQLEGSTKMDDSSYNYPTVTDSLVIGFNPDSLTAYQDQQLKVYPGLFNAKLTILQFYEMSGPQPVVVPLATVQQKNFSVELAMQYQPYLKTHYLPGDMFVSASSTYDASKSQLRVNWAPNITPYLGTVTPAQYDLEWTYSDDYATDGSPLPASQVPYTFKNNATRVTTDSLFYNIPVVYPRGYLIYRVRMVRVDSNQYQYPIYGPWSPIAVSGNVGSLSSNYYYIPTAHLGDSTNWDYSIQFAENGKYKHVLSYSDGMLKNRQTITRFNSEPTRLLVTENIYDYEGRPSITTLPSVVNTTDFRYQDSVSISSVTNKPYAAVDFDTRPVSCPDNAIIPPFLAGSKANRYYSILNTDTAGAQKFVPRANGYPFVHTQLSPGFADRIDKQGGAGDVLQVNMGHDQHNDYAMADQPNLNALFGLNAGFSSYYTKTVSKDQNGQYSMSIKDFRGKQVATALIGTGVDTSTAAIMFNDEVPANKKFKEDKLANVYQPIVGHQKKWGGNQYIDVDGALIKVKYEYIFQPFQVCSSPYVGLSVKGDYDYTVHDPCGVEKLHKFGTLGATGITFSNQPATATHDTDIVLDRGNHTINKTLSISTDEIYAAVDSFMAYHPSCAKTEDDFIKEEVEATPFPCAGVDEDPCGELEKQMEEELFPKTGKYGTYTRPGGVIVGTTPSIFDVLSNNPDAISVGDYRYQGPCVATDLNSLSVTVYGNTYTALGSLPVDTFEFVYEHAQPTDKYSIAHALLPLHPEYCRLQGCFVDTFETRFKAIPDAAAAVKYGLFTLTDIVNKDGQLTSKLIVAPFNLIHIDDSLKMLFGGTVRMDTLASEFAFCSNDDAVAFGDARKFFHTQIVALNFPDDKTKNAYFEKLRTFYLMNRDKWKNVAQTGGGNNCLPCDSAYRMTLKPPPLSPQIYNINGTFATGPGSLLGMFSPTAQGNIAWLMNGGSGSGTTQAAIQQYQDSAINAAAHADTLLTYAAIDSILSKLSNCYPTSSARTRLSDTLHAMFARHEVKNGVFLPNQVRYAILAAGLSLDDLCHPYLVNYDYYQPSNGTHGSCKSGSFYNDVRDFLNDPAIISALTSTNSTPVSTAPTYDIAGNFAQLIRNQLGGSDPSIQITRYDVADKTYKLTFTMGGVDTVEISLKSNVEVTIGTNTMPLCYTAGSLSFDNVSCYFEDPQAYAEGRIGHYMFKAKVTRLDQVSGANQTTKADLNGWTNGTIEMSETSDNQLAVCVPCTQFKDIFKDFRDTMTAYGGYAADHPLFDVSLRNFANYNLKRWFGEGQYSRFLQSCALADSMIIPAYGGWAKMNFTGSASFASFQQSSATGAQALVDFQPTASSEFVIVDNTSIPYDQLRGFRATLLGMSGSQIANTPATGVGELWIPAPSANTISAIIANSGFNSTLITSGNALLGGASNAYDHYTLSATGTSTPQQLSIGIAAIRQNIYDNNIQGYWQPNALATVNEDYNKPQKQQYLAYTYSAQTRPAPRVLDTVRDFMLTANLSSFSGNDVSYSNPANPDRFTDLYYTTSTNIFPGFTKLNDILHGVTTTLSGNVCMATTTNTVMGIGMASGTLMLYRCRDGLYWYRYFDQSKKLYNIYIRVPKYIYQSTHPTFTVAGIRLATGDSATRRFTALLVSNLMPNDTIKAAGSTDFDLAWSNKLTDVLLGNEDAQAHNPQAISGEVGALPNCEQERLYQAVYTGKAKYRLYFEHLRDSLKSAFYAHVMGQLNEKLWIEYIDKRFAYTLYSYDLAGNLIQTVPPEGVQKIDSVNASLVDGLRLTNGFASAQVPHHNKVSHYEFNTVNLPLREITPDGGVKDRYYDAKGNTILSQNDKQRKNGLFTYSLYDGQNRIVETGEVQWNECPYFANTPLYVLQGGVWTKTNKPNACACENLTDSLWTYCMPTYITNRYDNNTFDSIIRTKARTQVVATVYDAEFMNIGALNGMSRQENLRSRVAANMYYESCPPGIPGSNYTHATHYSYDAEGNVKSLVQDFPELDGVKQRYKRVDYEYDLHSGKVNMLSYNRGYADQFYQRYTYDADNRMVKAETSHDGFIWKRDAEYTYYQHGPLARTSIGDQRVQGVDYAYTLQGWLKSINGSAADSMLDMGGDGLPATITPKDAFATEINYFTNDYSPIAYTAFSNIPGQTKSLYNGAIARQTTDLTSLGGLTTAYTYDQMNRIRSAQYAKLQAGILAFNNWYASAYKYDQDGNIKSLWRKEGTGTTMDSLVYNYPNATQNNKLADVLEYKSFSQPGIEDLKLHTTGSNRFLYDEIGNLVKDNTSNTDTVKWNIYDKTIDVLNNTQKWDLHFTYDGTGQRVSKNQTIKTDTGDYNRNTYYVRDVTGNILAEYEMTRSWDTGGARIRAIRGLYDQIGPILGQSGSGINGTWISALSSGGYLSNSSFANAITAVGGNSIPSQTAGYFLSKDASLSSQFLQSGSDVLPAMCNYSLSTTDYVIADAMMLELRKTDPGKKIQKLSDILYKNPDAAQRHSSMGQLCQAVPEIYSQLCSDYHIQLNSSNDSVEFYSTLDGIDPNYFSQALINRWRSNHDGIYNWVAKVTTDSAYLGNEYFLNNGYTEELMETLLNYSDDAANDKSQANQVSKEAVGVYGFGTWWPTAMARIQSSLSPEDLRLIAYYDDPQAYMQAFLSTGNLNEAVVDNALADISSLDVLALSEDLGIQLITPQAVPIHWYDAGPQIKWQTIHLASHHMYGNDRIGIDGYWSKQYDALWDFKNNNVDTIRLLQRLPWFSCALNEPITSYTTTPWGNGLSDKAVAQHVVGQKQYELTNQVGNVMATISDKRFIKLGPTGQRIGFAAAIPALYDYYPFGMLMPGRTIRDTSSQCVQVSQMAVVAQATSISSQPNINGIALHGSTLSPGPMGSVWVYGQSGGWSKTITGLTPNSPVTLTVTIGYMVVAPASISVTEQAGLGAVNLGGQTANSAASYILTFTPSTSQITVSVALMHSMATAQNLLQVTDLNYSQTQSVTIPTLVQLCNKADDKYEFGFNGQMKTNEIAGIGNHNTAEFWEYDTRLGRRWNRDPKSRIGISEYSTFGNNPIIYRDKNGDVIGIDNLFGALWGAAIEIGSQMITNYIEKKPLLNLDWADVGISALEGGLTSGLSTATKVGKITKIGIKVGAAFLRSSVDIKKDDKGNYRTSTLGGVVGSKKPTNEVLADGISETIGIVAGVYTDRVAGTASKALGEADNAAGKAVRAFVEKSVGGLLDGTIGGVKGAIKDQGVEERKTPGRIPHITVGTLIPMGTPIENKNTPTQTPPQSSQHQSTSAEPNSP